MNAQESFVHHMNAMREHHKSGATHTYSVPVDLLYASATNDSGLMAFKATDVAGNSEVTADLEAYKNDTNSFVEGQRSGATASVTILKDNKKPNDATTNSFVEAMENQKAEAKKASDALINKNYDKLIKAGIDHPGQQKRILSATEAIGAFFTTLLISVGKFFANLASSIVNFFNDIGEWFSNAGKSIANWTSGAISSVGKFFSSIF
ncbi:hypothetical protein CXF83_19175 [Shewanella sp. Choline-02u-19]|jgi:beta-mannanase|uniref:hypothetical protein n=1 Tax=unclassified Shewanella TaxID=196818 RepID=UPI000C3294F0|nr:MULTISPECIES: hypothetical protein [unclassified Shewanella]PKG55922.1 hypothetical protein CXF82_17325 [Shewanella sp. GutDb-MelDb]PKG76619.1 hypothetical protein CXF86_00630 [Shewanella sp. GutCb]PKH62464.1 hypothetical protein CXF84_01165 [Shewanella sp. Bg11-22]PKI28679.1 hypothetical protein CXF83_19175 [Shewanella sp. Choline-02u-19]